MGLKFLRPQLPTAGVPDSGSGPVIPQQVGRLSEIFRLLPVVQGPPQWGAADAEIKVPSGENTELKRSPF